MRWPQQTKRVLNARQIIEEGKYSIMAQTLEVGSYN